MAADSPRIAFVQVGVRTSIEPASLLPPLLQCCDDAVERFGEVELSGWQVTARDLEPGRGSAIWELTDGLGWFALASPQNANAVITFDRTFLRAQDESEFVASLRRFGAGFFEFGPRVPAPPDLVVDTALGPYPEIPLTPADWGVPVTLPEWSASSAAWALATVINTARTGNADIADFAVRISRVG